MKHWINGVVLAFHLCGLALVATAESQVSRGDLHVGGVGFSHSEGQAAAYLYRAQDKLPGKIPFKKAYAPIVGSMATLVFENLPFGDYAIILIHDENGNGEPDSLLGRIPLEPLAFSNGFNLSLMSGLPSFEKLRITFGADTPAHVIDFQ